MTELLTRKILYLGKIKKKEGIKKDNTPWKLFKIEGTTKFGDKDEQIANFRLFDSTKGFEHLIEDKCVEITYVQEPFTDKEGVEKKSNKVKEIKPATDNKNEDKPLPSAVDQTATQTTIQPTTVTETGLFCPTKEMVIGLIPQYKEAMKDKPGELSKNHFIGTIIKALTTANKVIKLELLFIDIITEQYDVMVTDPQIDVDEETVK